MKKENCLYVCLPTVSPFPFAFQGFFSVEEMLHTKKYIQKASAF